MITISFEIVIKGLIVCDVENNSIYDYILFWHKVTLERMT